MSESFIFSSMKALVINDELELEIIDIPKPIPDKGEVLIKLKAAALNKRDYWISLGKYPRIETGVTLGSDGAGIVEELGDDVKKTWLDRAVILNPNINWGSNDKVQGREYTILGMPSNGTFAEYVVVNCDRLSILPQHLTFEQAAGLPLAGLTAFRACFHHGTAEKNKKILISGFGGGVAHFAFLFSKAVGAKVSITSGNPLSLQKGLEMKAEHAFNYNDENWLQDAATRSGGYDLIIDSAGGDQFNDLIKILNPAGKIVFYGASNGLPTSLDLYKLFWKQGTIQGSTMGSDKEFVEMVEFVASHTIQPLISARYPFEQVRSAIKQMEKSGAPGKTVIIF